MPSDIELSRRLEGAEGEACLQFAAARLRLFPECGGEWLRCGGGCAVFDGIDSPATQSFGLGIREPLTEETLALVERFFFDRGSAAALEMSPFAGVPAMDLLCRRGYRPIELSNVLYRGIGEPEAELPGHIRVRPVDGKTAELWSEVSARGWAQEHPELLEFLRGCGAIATARRGSVCFLAECDGVAGAASALCLHEGVALFAGAATVPELRRRGLQSALLQERLRHAFSQGCDLAMMVAEPGSASQRNAERNGFRIAYTRTKWLKNP